MIASLEGQLLDVIGDGGVGAEDGSYEQARFDHPQGMALVGDKLYVADTENHLLRVVDLTARRVTTLAGTGEQARGRLPGGTLRETALNSPWDLTVLKGTLYIAMAGPHQLWSHRLGSDRIEVFAGSGREDILDGDLQSAALAQPSGITHDGEALYFVDSEGSAVRQLTFAEGGKVGTLVGPHELPRGASLFEFGDVDGIADRVRLQHPLGIIRQGDQLFVADTYNHKLKLVSIPLRKSESWIGTGESGLGLEPLQFSEPAGLAIVGNELLVADTNNHRIVAIDIPSKRAREFVVQGLQPPQPKYEARDLAAGVAAIEQPEHTALSTQPLQISLQFDLPLGYKLNPLCTVVWKLDAVDGAGVVAAESIGKQMEVPADGQVAMLKLPLSGAGAGTYELTAQYQYCRDGDGGVCKVGRIRYRLPLVATPDGDASPLLLKVSPNLEGGG
ncbi:MAG: hypothetical protein R3B90_11055 [Planctomycetaceae bacterium]